MTNYRRHRSSPFARNQDDAEKQKFFLKLLCFALILTFVSQYTNGATVCPDVPQNCDTDLINFYLYNSAHPNGEKLNKQANQINNNGYLYVDGPIKFIIHGYTGGKENPRMLKLRTAYLDKMAKINVIHLDFNQLAKEHCYFTLLASIKIIGTCAAEFIKNEINTNANKITLDSFHIIGFSCGAHVAAILSQKCQDIGLLTRITGLDPALPGFHLPLKYAWYKLNRKHAKFVDVIHTNTGIRGVYSSDAHLDIYANYGAKQNGCGLTETLCSHARALDYFIESVNSNTGFYAVPCNMVKIYAGKCKKDLTMAIIVGDPCKKPNKKNEGVYHFDTNPTEPYAMGR